jgi:hypothetical protein
VLAAESFARAESVVSLNADNLYFDGGRCSILQQLARAGLIGFRQSGLLRSGDIPPERIRQFALIDWSDGILTRIVEKTRPHDPEAFGADPAVSMNLWLLPPTIFASCRAIQPSPRGELELQDAIRHNITVARGALHREDPGRGGARPLLQGRHPAGARATGRTGITPMTLRRVLGPRPDRISRQAHGLCRWAEPGLRHRAADLGGRAAPERSGAAYHR